MPLSYNFFLLYFFLNSALLQPVTFHNFLFPSFYIHAHPLPYSSILFLFLPTFSLYSLFPSHLFCSPSTLPFPPLSLPFPFPTFFSHSLIFPSCSLLSLPFSFSSSLLRHINSSLRAFQLSYRNVYQLPPLFLSHPLFLTPSFSFTPSNSLPFFLLFSL